MSNIADLFFQAAARLPDRIAIIHRDRSITYGELERQVRATAAHFRSKGLGPGDRVLVFVPMGIELYRIVLALFSMGAVAVFLDAWVSWKRLELCCELAACRGFIGSWKLRALAFLSSPLRRIPIKFGMALPRPGASASAPVEADASALITFTTGSTGTPKAALRSHGFLAAQFAALLEELSPTPKDVVMTTLPIVLLMDLGIGCTSVVPNFKAGKPTSFRGETVAQEIEKQKVDRLIASPAQVLALADHLLGSGTRLPSLRRIFTGGAPVVPREADRMCRPFPEAELRVVFGSTECEPISSIDATGLVRDHSGTDPGLCVGRIFHRTALRIIPIVKEPIPKMTTAELEAMSLSNGRVGEIIVSGDHVLRSYFNNEEAFRRNKIIVDDTIWHRTGDSGYVDDRGLLYLTGRCAQLIHRNGRVISPFAWEDRLSAHPGVARGTIVEQKGLVTAVLQLEHGGDREGVKSALLSSHEELQAVAFIRRMPMDPRHRSKIDHEALRKLIG